LLNGVYAMFQLKLYAGLIVLGLLGMGAIKVNHSIHYVPVMASVTEVSSNCYLESVSRGVVTKTTTTTEHMPCAEAETLKADHPAYKDMKVKGMIDVSFTYTSPVDKSEQTGELSYFYDSYNGVAAMDTGEELPILAHKSEAQTYTRDMDHMASFATVS
jgi:hypothetical protein